MVSALKINNKSNKGLDSFIKKLSGETTKEYEIKEQEKKSFVDKSIQNLAVNSIIEGYFPKENFVRDMAIKRVNKTLCVILSLLIGIVVVSYYFVISCEMKLNDFRLSSLFCNSSFSLFKTIVCLLKSFNFISQEITK